MSLSLSGTLAAETSTCWIIVLLYILQYLCQQNNVESR